MYYCNHNKINTYVYIYTYPEIAKQNNSLDVYACQMQIKTALEIIF